MDGAAFYKALAYKLQLVHGQVGYKPSTQELGVMAQQIADIQPAAEKERINVSVHRCLISIGDLTRWVAKQCVAEACLVAEVKAA